ncbi:DUF547 domain-containing protein [Alkalimarinus sediminis]|uniref:DUF547 domain-containing protein n=1 Tax=Alkalimarinus sediminis TaxID=1632866 RepID=A0A9E8HLR1_9ALTE|nr:DUF547 domain-containing protein [Alkalimarinus sediminis]UZW76442.1 DUF547 domain-containing protein [Alkalimarinus sediminis]
MAKFISFAISILFFVSTASAAPKSDLWERWDLSNEASDVQVSHAQWSIFLSKYAAYVDPATNTRLVDYSAVSHKDHRVLKAYISMLTDIDPLSLNKAEQFAYWVNLYNAATVDLILDNYPVKSITKLGGFFSFGPWNEEIVEVSGEAITLNDIEHRILRPIWKDKRIHYAVNCASIGCPNLYVEAFQSSKLESQLESATRTFINSDKAVQFINGKLILSEIYNWYAVDFGDEKSLIQHLLNYYEGPLYQQLQSYSGEIEYQYDWKLNEKK